MTNSSKQLCVMTCFSPQKATPSGYLIYCRPSFTPVPNFLVQHLQEMEAHFLTQCITATIPDLSTRQIILNPLEDSSDFIVRTKPLSLFIGTQLDLLRDWMEKNGLPFSNLTSQPIGIGLMQNVSGPSTDPVGVLAIGNNLVCLSSQSSVEQMISNATNGSTLLSQKKSQ